MRPKGENTRDKILEVATSLINQKGIGATTIQDIASAMNMKKASLYFHFKDKDEICCAVLEKAREDFRGFLETTLTGDTAGERLDRFLSQAFSKHQATSFTGGCIFGNSALETRDSNTRFATIIRSVFDDWSTTLCTTIETAQTEGRVRDDLPASLLATQVIATIEGAIMLSRLYKDERPMRDCLEMLRSNLRLKLP